MWQVLDGYRNNRGVNQRRWRSPWHPLVLRYPSVNCLFGLLNVLRREYIVYTMTLIPLFICFYVVVISNLDAFYNVIIVRVS